MKTRLRSIHDMLSAGGLSAAALLLLISAIDLSAQRPRTETGDTTEIEDDWGEDWTLDSLNAEDFEFDTEQIFHLSRGWFPTPFKAASIALTGIFPYADVFDRASGLRTRAFEPTTAPFDWHNPYNGSAIGEFLGFENKERRILRPNEDEPVEDGYPRTLFGEFGLQFLYHLPVPAILRANGAYRFADGLLFSEDTSRSYLSLDGVPRSFREIGVIYHEQHIVSGTVGLQIPVYGVFLDSDFGSIGSYYYLFGGLSGDYAFSAKTTQYAQIADAKDQIRYRNGQDTTTLMRRGTPEGINRTRTAVEAGIGWELSGEYVVLGFELFLSSPLTSLVDDAEWKQYYAGIRLNAGFQWGTRLQSK